MACKINRKFIADSIAQRENHQIYYFISSAVEDTVNERLFATPIYTLIRRYRRFFTIAQIFLFEIRINHALSTPSHFAMSQCHEFNVCAREHFHAFNDIHINLPLFMLIGLSASKQPHYGHKITMITIYFNLKISIFFCWKFFRICIDVVFCQFKFQLKNICWAFI